MKPFNLDFSKDKDGLINLDEIKGFQLCLAQLYQHVEEEVDELGNIDAFNLSAKIDTANDQILGMFEKIKKQLEQLKHCSKTEADLIINSKLS